MTTFELREVDTIQDAAVTSLAPSVPFTQASFYGDWQKTLGRKVRRFFVTREDDTLAYFQIIRYPLLFGKNYLYIPYGPVVKDASEELLSFIRKELKRIAKEEHAVFVRLDFTPSLPNALLSKLFTKAPLYTYHSAYFQPRLEWFLDLRKSEDELMAGMHEKTRYSIRTGEKRGAVAEVVTKEFNDYFDEFYALMEETAKRNDFSIHPKAYYKTIFNSLSGESAYLVVARHEGTILAIDLCIVFSGIANYIFAGSSSADRGLMPSYVAQWKAIKYAKQLGANYYNFGGIADENLYSGWSGLTRFKKRFGGHEVRHSDFFDLVVSPFWYHLYNLRKWVKKSRA